MNNLTDLKISIAGKCSHCGHALSETFVAQGARQNIDRRVVLATPQTVLEAVSEAAEVHQRDITVMLRGGSRTEVALARRMYVWLLRRHLNMAWASVAETVGYADHTAAHYASTKFDEEWHQYLHECLGVSTPGNEMQPWFEDKGDGQLWLHVTNTVEDLKRAYSWILRSKVKVKK